MAGGRRFGIKGRKIVCAKEWEIESGDNMVTPWYTGSKTWREIELVARGDKRYVDRYNICQRMKNWTKTPVGKLMVNEVSEKP